MRAAQAGRWVLGCSLSKSGMFCLLSVCKENIVKMLSSSGIGLVLGSAEPCSSAS